MITMIDKHEATTLVDNYPHLNILLTFNFNRDDMIDGLVTNDDGHSDWHKLPRTSIYDTYNEWIEELLSEGYEEHDLTPEEIITLRNQYYQ